MNVARRNLTIDGATLLMPSVHHEWRGQIFTLYDDGYGGDFVEDKISVSHRHVLRGLHGDFVTKKLISCLSGSVYFVIADMRQRSPTYGKWEGLVLNDQNRHQVIVPAGVLNAHLCLTESCMFWYKQTVKYGGQASQYTVYWCDKFLEIDWPIDNPILSTRDRYNTMPFESIKGDTG